MHVFHLFSNLSTAFTKTGKVSQKQALHCIYIALKCTECRFQILGGLSGSEERGGGDNTIQFINFGRVGDKNFKEWQQK